MFSCSSNGWWESADLYHFRLKSLSDLLFCLRLADEFWKIWRICSLTVVPALLCQHWVVKFRKNPSLDAKKFGYVVCSCDTEWMNATSGNREYRGGGRGLDLLRRSPWCTGIYNKVSNTGNCYGMEKKLVFLWSNACVAFETGTLSFSTEMSLVK